MKTKTHSTASIFFLSSYEDDALVYFNAVWDNATAGAESFFLVRGEATPVSEPSTLVLMGLGLIGFGLARRAATRQASRLRISRRRRR
jgi:hypothetical protein